MRSLWLIVLLISAAPGLLSAHGSEYLGAKFYRDDQSGVVTVEVTADYGANPLLESAEAAEAAVSRLLQISLNGHWTPLEAVAKVELMRHHTPDETSPLPSDPQTDQPHDLLTGRWAWLPPRDLLELVLRVQPDEVQPVIFWISKPGVARANQKWAMLQGGEETPRIELPHVPSISLWVCFSVIFAALLALGSFQIYRRQIS